MKVREIRSGIQCCFIIIIHIPKGFRHGLAENEVDAIQHIFSAAEVLGKNDFSGLTAFFHRIRTVFLIEQLGHGKTETVNALLHIPYHKAVVIAFISAGYCCQQHFLHHIAVLILVNHDFIILLLHLFCGICRNDVVFGAAGFREDLQGKMFIVIEIQPEFFFFRLCKGFRKTNDCF